MCVSEGWFSLVGVALGACLGFLLSLIQQRIRDQKRRDEVENERVGRLHALIQEWAIMNGALLHSETVYNLLLDSGFSRDYRSAIAEMRTILTQIHVETEDISDKIKDLYHQLGDLFMYLVGLQSKATGVVESMDTHRAVVAGRQIERRLAASAIDYFRQQLGEVVSQFQAKVLETKQSSVELLELLGYERPREMEEMKNSD